MNMMISYQELVRTFPNHYPCLLFIPFSGYFIGSRFFLPGDDLRIIIIVRWPDKTRIAIRQRDVQEIMRLHDAQ